MSRLRSLRVRFFLISWPLVVAAVLVVAWGFERWTRVELERIEGGGPGSPADPARAARFTALAERVAAEWAEHASEGDRWLAYLATEGGEQEAPVDLALVGIDGALHARSTPALRLEAGEPGANGARQFVRASADPASGLESEEALVTTGLAISAPGGAPLGTLFVLPRAPASARPLATELRASARRTLWTTVAVASAAAAAAALLLAGPLVGQIGRLERAAAAIRQGRFATRVATGGADELGRLERSFNAMAESLDAAEQRQRDLVGDVAHELRTPLTNLVGQLEAIEDGLRAPDAAALASLREEVALLAALVDELQELHLADAGQLRFELEAIDAVEAACAALETFRLAGVAAGGVELVPPVRSRAASPSAGLLVRADRRRLAQVLRNLIANALTHTPAGGRVAVEVERRGGSVAIAVIDDGCGIPAAHLPLVFERFHRVDPSRDRASGGMGLGLVLVRELATGMGGTVAVESVEGAGATFTVVLPAADDGARAG